MASIFKVGDRVCIWDESCGSLYGKPGTIITIEKLDRCDWIGVCFDEAIDGLHDLRGHCEDGHGWFVDDFKLCYLDESEIRDEDIADAADLYAFINA